MRKLLLIVLIVLVAGVSIVFTQSRLRRKTASVTITTAGAIELVPTTGQGVKIGTAGTALTKIAKYTTVLSPAQVAANTCAEETFTVTGISTTDVVFVNKPTAQAGLGVAGVRASAADQVAINFCNATATPITPTASQTYSFAAIK